MNKLIVKKAAVLGAGVMGAQIAAHLANANVPVVLFDLPAKEGDKNGIVNKALDGLKKLDPAPLVAADAADGAAFAASTLQSQEIAAIRRAVQAAGGNIARAARQLGVARNTVYRKLKGG